MSLGMHPATPKEILLVSSGGWWESSDGWVTLGAGGSHTPSARLIHLSSCTRLVAI